MSFSMKFRIMNVSLFPPIQAKNNSGRNALIRVINQDQRLHVSIEFRDEYHFFTLLISCCPKDVSGNYLDFKQYFKRIVFNYKKTWKHSNASHSIMHGYTHGRYIILKSRRFSIELNKHKNFNNEHSGFQHVMDNVFCKAAGGGGGERFQFIITHFFSTIFSKFWSTQFFQLLMLRDIWIVWFLSLVFLFGFDHQPISSWN